MGLTDLLKRQEGKTLVVFANLAFAASLCLAAEPEIIKSTYTASQENFPNPERGFYYQTSYTRGMAASRRR